MCGIAGAHGLESFQGLEDAQERIQKMTGSLSHGGPDAEGVWTDREKVVLGHRRLSILDTGSGANQPLVLAQDALVFNGEVYNYLELRQELEASCGHAFVTQGDTEVVLVALRHWGLDRTLAQLNGMFAFGWWSADSESLFLVRDRMGIKPLYWHQTPKGTVLFASEVRTLLASELVPRNVDREALSEQLMYGTVHAPRTVIDGVQLMPPGSLLKIQGAELHEATWWDPAQAAQAVPGMSHGERLTYVRDTLSDSVGLRMRSDVSYGAFLSGGIDSSAVVGLMSQRSAQPVSTFSVVFDDAALDEGPWSRAMAQKFGTHHHEIRLTPSDFLDQVPDGLAAMDHPSPDGLNTYVVSGATRSAGVKVALSGLGGDELFAGYPVFERSARLARLNWLGAWPPGLRKMVGKAYCAWKPGMTSRKMAEVLGGHYFDVAHTYPLSRQMFLHADLQRMLKPNVPLNNALFQWLVKALAPGTAALGLPFLSQVSIAELRTYMGHTLLRDADQFSMAHALEVRVPFLDHRLVAAALAAPDVDKYPTTPKRLLVDALDGLLPEDLVNRPKMGFVMPWEAWMRGELQQTCSQGWAALKDQAWVNGDEIGRMETAFVSGRPEWSWSRMWSLAVLGDYLERHGLH